VDRVYSQALRGERTGIDPLRRPCFVCVHSEFVHADAQPRECLYSDCACGSFTIDLASIERGNGRGAA
jgi:hypothetical protein